MKATYHRMAKDEELLARELCFGFFNVMLGWVDETRIIIGNIDSITAAFAMANYCFVVEMREKKIKY